MPILALEATTVEVWTAVGTVGAVVVALFVSTLSTITTWYRRPRLVIRLGSIEPHIRGVMEGFRHDGFILRVEVRNDGRSEARRVRAYVQDWWIRTDDKLGYRWIKPDLDPFPVEWVVSRSHITDLAPQSSEYAPLSRYEVSAGATSLCMPADREVPHRATHSNYPLGEHRIRLAVVSETAKAVTEVISYTTSSEHFISSVRPSEAPTGARLVGILAMLRGPEAPE